MFPPRQVESNVICYRIFFHPQSLSDVNDVLHIFSPKISDLIRVSKNLVGNFIWHKHEFSLSLMTNSKSEHFKYFYGGKSDVGDAMQDEWLITYILWNITKQYPNVVVQLWDTDGDFLLIEAADYLPDWVTPEISRNRVFFKNGKLHLVKKNLNSSKIPVEEALNAVFNSKCISVASEPIQEALMAKLGSVPRYIEENHHTARCLIPKSIARILAERPELIAPAVEAFYYREPSSASNVVSKMKKFSPVDVVENMVTMSRCMYAQLKHQDFFPPKPFAHLRESLISNTQNKQAVIDLGIKITCGFELMYSEEQCNQEGVKWRDILDQIIQIDSPGTEDFLNVLTEDDDASWLHLDPNIFDQKLMSTQCSTSSFNENGEELKQIASLFNEFIEKSSGVEGVQSMEPVSFDFNSFMDLLNGMEEEEYEEDDYDDERDDEPSEQVIEETDGVIDDSEEKISLHGVMNAMDAQLAVSHLGSTFKNVPDSSIQESDGPEKEIETALNLDYNLLSNLLESFASQEGQSGPFSNMLGEMGYVETSTD